MSRSHTGKAINRTRIIAYKGDAINDIFEFNRNVSSARRMFKKWAKLRGATLIKVEHIAG